MALSIPVAIVIAAVPARCRNASTVGGVFSDLGTGFIATVIAALIGWVALMVMWGMSVS